jgi:hypothetical protein
MGILKDTRAKSAHDDAARALAQGRQVFMLRINPGTRGAGSSGAAWSFAEQIEAVEQAGWALDQMAFTGDDRRASGYFLFRPRR